MLFFLIGFKAFQTCTQYERRANIYSSVTLQSVSDTELSGRSGWSISLSPYTRYCVVVLEDRDNTYRPRDYYENSHSTFAICMIPKGTTQLTQEFYHNTDFPFVPFEHYNVHYGQLTHPRLHFSYRFAKRDDSTALPSNGSWGVVLCAITERDDYLSQVRNTDVWQVDMLGKLLPPKNVGLSTLGKMIQACCLPFQPKDMP